MCSVPTAEQPQQLVVCRIRTPNCCDCWSFTRFGSYARAQAMIQGGRTVAAVRVTEARAVAVAAPLQMAAKMLKMETALEGLKAVEVRMAVPHRAQSQRQARVAIS